MSQPALMTGPNTLVQNTVYATPGKSKWCVSDAVIAVCNTTAGTFVPVAASTTGGFLLGGALFVKATTGNANVSLSDQ